MTRPDISWQDRARCQGTDVEAFHPGSGPRRLPLRICAACEVRPECLEYALAMEKPSYREGIWGGTTAAERQDIATQRANGHGGTDE